jgi:chemotaxis protein methyltransferase CheR
MQESDFVFIQRLVEESSGIILEKGKEYLAELRLTPLARQKDLPSLHELVEAMKSNASPEGLRALVVEAMTTNETTFFRDVQPFETLRTWVLPALITNRLAVRRLTFWCAASSTGQEPYSVAMLIREHFPELGSWRIEFLASDISKAVLDRAAQGIYSTLEVNRGLPAVYREKYFEKRGESWQVKEEIRRMVNFRPVNLMRDWPSLVPQDVIFIRNVLIYFDVPSKKRILEHMAELIRPDGYLFLGGAETTLNLCPAFERIPANLTSCFRPKSPAVVP